MLMMIRKNTDQLHVALWPVLEDAEHAASVLQRYEQRTRHALEHQAVPPEGQKEKEGVGQ